MYATLSLARYPAAECDGEQRRELGVAATPRKADHRHGGGDSSFGGNNKWDAITAI